MGKDRKSGVAINSNTLPDRLTPSLSRTTYYPPLLASLLFIKHLFFAFLKHLKSLHLSPLLADNSALNLPELIQEIRREIHSPAAVFTSWFSSCYNGCTCPVPGCSESLHLHTASQSRPHKNLLP